MNLKLKILLLRVYIFFKLFGISIRLVFERIGLDLNDV